MKKVDIKADGEIQPSLTVKAYSVAQILSAGGASAFAAQKAKNPQSISSKLKSLSTDSFLTQSEADSALKALKNNK